MAGTAGMAAGGDVAVDDAVDDGAAAGAVSLSGALAAAAPPSTSSSPPPPTTASAPSPDISQLGFPGFKTLRGESTPTSSYCARVHAAVFHN